MSGLYRDPDQGGSGMKKIVDHVDHVVWACRLETIEANVAELEKRTGAKFDRVEHGMGILMYVDWSAGLEVQAPLESDKGYGKTLTDWLDAHGEGILGVVFGVRDLEARRVAVESLGVEVGPLMTTSPTSPYRDQLFGRERMTGTVMNTIITLGEIDYADGLISFEDV
jgi:hypothetical protein